MNIFTIIIQAIIGVIVFAPTLWIVGRWRVGSDKAKLTDAIWISALSTIINALIGSVVGGIVGSVAQLVVTLFLIKKYYETDWLNSLVISVAATLLLLFVFFALAFAGIALLT